MKNPFSKRWIVIASLFAVLVGGIALSGCEGESPFEDVTCTEQSSGTTYNCSEGEYGCGGETYNCNNEGGDCMNCFETDCLGGCSNCFTSCTQSCVDESCNTSDCTGTGSELLIEGDDYTIVGDLEVLSVENNVAHCRFRVTLNFSVQNYRRYDVNFALRRANQFDRYDTYLHVAQGDDRHTTFNNYVEIDINIVTNQGYVSSPSDLDLDLVSIKAYK